MRHAKGATFNNILAEKKSQTAGQITYHSLEGVKTGEQNLGKGLVNIWWVPVCQTLHERGLSLFKGDKKKQT